MSIKKRIDILERHFSSSNTDVELDRELTEWFAANPEYILFAQQENSNGLSLPEHLTEAFQKRLEKIFIEKNMTLNLCNLSKLGQELYDRLRS